jgi:hypothetical protein
VSPRKGAPRAASTAVSIDDILAAKQLVPRDEDLESAVKALIGWVPPAEESEAPPQLGRAGSGEEEGDSPPGLERGIGADAPPLTEAGRPARR